MICVLISESGEDFKVIDPQTKEVLTDKYECNLMVIRTTAGKWMTGFHIGTECDETLTAELEANHG